MVANHDINGMVGSFYGFPFLHNRLAILPEFFLTFGTNWGFNSNFWEIISKTRATAFNKTNAVNCQCSVRSTYVEFRNNSHSFTAY